MVCAVVVNIADSTHVPNDMGTVSISNNIWSVLWLSTLGTWVLSAIATTYGLCCGWQYPCGDMGTVSNSNRPYGLLLWLSVPIGYMGTVSH